VWSKSRFRRFKVARGRLKAGPDQWQARCEVTQHLISCMCRRLHAMVQHPICMRSGGSDMVTVVSKLETFVSDNMPTTNQCDESEPIYESTMSSNIMVLFEPKELQFNSLMQIIRSTLPQRVSSSSQLTSRRTALTTSCCILQRATHPRAPRHTGSPGTHPAATRLF
jgi:hypothetical protein